MASNKDRDEAERPGRTRSAYEAARSRTQSAYETAKGRAGDVTDQLAVYPVGAVVGGFLVGALIAGLLPRTQREDRLLGGTGKKLTGAARDVARRGIDAGKEQVEALRAKAAEKVGEAVVDVVAGKQ